MEPILLMAWRRDLAHDQPEAEPVLVGVEQGVAVLELDDGQTISLDLRELEGALGLVPLAGLRRAA